jgi:hypothetical protein
MFASVFGNKEEKLVIATKYGRLREVQRLIEIGADKDVRDQYVSHEHL